VKPVARMNRAASTPPEPATEIGGSATEHDWDVESAAHGHVRPGSCMAFTDIDCRSGRGLEHEWRTHRPAGDPDGARRSGDRHTRGGLAFEQWAHDRHLENRSGFGIANQEVGEAM
jgi:hypothetical protein